MEKVSLSLIGLAVLLALVGGCQQGGDAVEGAVLATARAGLASAPAPGALRAKASPKAKLPWEPGVVLVKFRPEVSAATADGLAGSLGLARGKPRRATGVDHMKLTTGESVPEAVARLSKDPRVLYAEPNHRIELLAAPNDPRFPECWGLDNTGQTGGVSDADIDALEAWDISIGSPDVVVAVVDTGVDYTHPDLAANIWVNVDEIPANGVDDDGNGFVDDVRGYDFVGAGDNDPMDEDSHGTHCSGTIGAVGNDGAGVAGVNWRVSIMPVRIIGWEEPDAFCLDAAEGIQYAVDNGARVLSNSWWTVRQYNQTLHDTVMGTEATGAVLVFAAGNYGEDVDDPAMNIYPASWHPANMIGVAATTHNDEIVTYDNTGGMWASNFGATTIDVGAPGADILSSILGGGYELYSGTSMATPHVAGTVALMLSIRPDLDPAGVKAALFGTVDPLPSLQGVTTTGGRINAHRALQVISGMPLPPVALAGGNRSVTTGSEVILDGSRSFDPNQDPITYAWEFYPPGHSSATIDDPLIAAPRFTADVCGLYQAVLVVTDDGGLVSRPDRAKIQALNLDPLDPIVESPHPYTDDYSNEWIIHRPGAVVLAAHFSLFDTEGCCDHVVILDGAGNEVARYSGQRGAFDTPAVEGDTIVVRFTSDYSVTGQGFTIDQLWWCDAGACAPGLGDCNDDPADGCETDTSQDPAHCGWCGHSCARPHAQVDCVAAQCQFVACDAGYVDCDGLAPNGCESDPLVDPQNCNGCGNACEAMPNALPGCANGACAITECLPGWDDCNGVLADGCETDVTADPVNCGACFVECLALPGVENAYCDASQCWLGNCATVDQVVESPHPYANNFTQTWPVHVPGSSRLRVHFQYVDVEPGWDTVEVLDGRGSVVETFSQYAMPPFWSAWIEGTTLQIRLTTDVSVQANGFFVDQVMSCGEGACLEGYADCDHEAGTGCEVDTTADPQNCGGCGIVCPTPDHVGAGCDANGCFVSGCQAGFGDCNGDPADGCERDISADEANCGACGVACAPAHGVGECLASQCTIASCEAGRDDCDGDPATGCEVELASDPLHCGACGAGCAAPAHAAAACVASACAMGACEPGFGDCDQDPADGCEVDLTRDALHCGDCLTACSLPHATAACVASACAVSACDAGHGDCNELPADGCEAELASDPQNCGACGADCDPYHHCEAGGCVPDTCATGFADCNGDPADGCEAELAVDPLNCGGCGAVCALAHATEACVASVCAVGACEEGFGDCDGDAGNGCEVALASDHDHCGVCRRACAAAQACLAGECVACPDADGDGAADAACGGPDCDDGDAAVHPGADELCDNQLDDDCDGTTDSDCDEGTGGGGCACGSADPQGPAWLGLALGLGLLATHRRKRR